MIKSHKTRILALLALVVGLVAATFLLPVDSWVPYLVNADIWRSPIGVILFILLYLVWNFALPPAPLQFLAGMHFGLLGGLVVIIIGTSLANIVSHALARWLGRIWVAERLAKSKRLLAMEEAIAQMGWQAVVLLRLSNLFPSNLANLLMGVTPLRLPTILWASIVGSIPGWILMLLLGQGGRALLNAEFDPGVQLVVYLGSLVVTVIFLTLLGRRAYFILNEKADAQPP